MIFDLCHEGGGFKIYEIEVTKYESIERLTVQDIEDNIFDIYDTDNDFIYDYDSWKMVKEIKVKKYSNSSPKNLFFITKDNKPYLLVKIYYDSPLYGLFDGIPITVWYGFLFVRMPVDVRYINLETFEISNLETSFYSCGLYDYSEVLLISSAKELYCLDEKCQVVWTTQMLACDGVFVHGRHDNCLYVDGNVDPPEEDGWIDYEIDIKTGQILNANGTWVDHWFPNGF